MCKSLSQAWYDEDRGIHQPEQSAKTEATVRRIKELLAAGCKCVDGKWYQDGVSLGDNSKYALEALKG